MKELQRKSRINSQSTLFEIEPGWRELWWGMPEFSMEDCSPQYTISINFMTASDVQEFSRVTGIPVSVRSDSAWFPHQRQLNGSIEHAYSAVCDKIVHTDAPTEHELDMVREAMPPLSDVEMLSLNWLRNRIVTLRKAGKMKASKA